MVEILSLFCLAGAFGLLLALSIIDLKVGLLPNKLVLPLLLLGIFFHALNNFQILSLLDMGLGGLIGGGILYGIKILADKYYAQDSLGLGDVKLLAAAGIWLGPHHILLAMTLGALAGIIHGLGVSIVRAVKTKASVNLTSLSIPAGPGFAIGIVAAGILKFWIEAP